jgi:effector-binding domain-containing protein
MKRFAQLLILIVIVILIIPVFLPDKISASAEKEFNVPAGMVYEEFNNMREFSEWEPWTMNDSLAKQEFFSPYRGIGSGYKWETTNGIAAEITVEKAESNKFITYKLEDLNLGKNSQMKTEFTQVPGNKTQVKWSIESNKIGYFSRYYSYFTSSNLEKKLNEGLNNLAERIQTSALTPEQAQSLVPNMIKTEMFQGEKLLTVLNETSLDPKEIETATEESLGLIYSYLTDYLKMAPQKVGNPVSYYEFIDLASKKAKFYSGYPITESVKLEDGMTLHSIPAGTTLVSIHKGNYENISSTIDKMKQYAKENNLKTANSFWEEYLNDPAAVKNKNELMTKIYIPILE